MSNNQAIQVHSNDEAMRIGIKTIDGVQCYEVDGTVYLSVKAAAFGLGLTKEAASGNTVVNWTRVRNYLKELGVVQKCTTGDFIPENIFYRLAMKAKNEAAKKFQAKVADEIMPAIRKHGAYMTPQTAQSILDNPDNAIILAKALLEEHEKRLAAERQSEALQLTNSMLSQQINTWDERKVTNAIVRAYCNRRCGGNFQMAWNTLYKRLEYKRGINIRSRRTKSSDDLRPLINFIRSSEWPAVLSVAASMCVEANLEPSAVIGPENVKRYLAT